MKLSQEALTALKNFQGINNKIIVSKGSTLRTISDAKDLIAFVDVKDKFEKDFSIYSLSSLLGVISLYEDADLKFEDDHVGIVAGNNKSKFYFCDPALVTKAPTADAKMPSEDVELVFTQEMRSKIAKGAAVLGLPNISITGDGETLRLVAHDVKNPKSNEFAFEIGETAATFSFDFTVEQITRIIEGDYDVTLSSKKLVRFKNKVNTFRYYLAALTSSSYEG